MYCLRVTLMVLHNNFIAVREKSSSTFGNRAPTQWKPRPRPYMVRLYGTIYKYRNISISCNDTNIWYNNRIDQTSFHEILIRIKRGSYPLIIFIETEDWFSILWQIKFTWWWPYTKILIMTWNYLNMSVCVWFRIQIKSHLFFFRFFLCDVLLSDWEPWVSRNRFLDMISNQSQPCWKQKSVRIRSNRSCLEPDLANPCTWQISESSELLIPINLLTVTDLRTLLRMHFPFVFLLYRGGTITSKFKNWDYYCKSVNVRNF